MTELLVADWARSVSWYAETLGLRVALRDKPNRFALLEAPGGGRVALKEGAAVTGRCRLVFQVDDLDAERLRLASAGVAVDGPLVNDRERYRELRLTDPDGTPITLFAWMDR